MAITFDTFDITPYNSTDKHNAELSRLWEQCDVQLAESEALWKTTQHINYWSISQNARDRKNAIERDFVLKTTKPFVNDCIFINSQLTIRNMKKSKKVKTFSQMFAYVIGFESKKLGNVRLYIQSKLIRNVKKEYIISAKIGIDYLRKKTTIDYNPIFQSMRDTLSHWPIEVITIIFGYLPLMLESLFHSQFKHKMKDFQSLFAVDRLKDSWNTAATKRVAKTFQTDYRILQRFLKLLLRFQTMDTVESFITENQIAIQN